MPAPSLFGADVEELSFYADMQTNNRLRFKVARAHTHTHSNSDQLSSNRRRDGMVMDLNCEIKPASHSQIYDEQKRRFEVPHEHVKTVSRNPSSPVNTVLEVKSQPFGLTVRRRESQKVL